MRGNALLPIYCSSANALDYHIRQACAALKEGRPPIAQNRHADAVAACLLLGDERTWLGRGSGVLSSSPSLRGLLPSLGETRACPRRARRTKLASYPCIIVEDLHSSAKGLPLGMLGRRCRCTSLVGRRPASLK